MFIIECTVTHMPRRLGANSQANSLKLSGSNVHGPIIMYPWEVHIMYSYAVKWHSPFTREVGKET